MSDLEVTVGLGDVDPYLIHWSAYPRLMDRAAAPVLAAQGAAGWLRDGHVGVRTFGCAFHVPVAFGDRLKVTTTTRGELPAPVVMRHEFRAAGSGALTAEGSCEYRSAGAGAGDLPAVPSDRPAVTLARRVALRHVDTAFLHWLSWIEWIDEATCALLASLGHPIGALHGAERLGLPLVRVDGGLEPVLGLDDEATVTTAVTAVGRSSVELTHTCAGRGRPVGWARTTHVCIDADAFRPVPAPDWLRTRRQHGVPCTGVEELGIARVREVVHDGSRRGRILAEAARLFAERGYGATSLNDLAAEAGIAKPTLFHYFTSKQQILFELYRRAMDLALARMRKVVAEGADPGENVVTWIREHALVILENRELFTILFDEDAALSPEQREIILAQQREYIHLISDPLRTLKSQGKMRASISPNIAAQALIGMANWVYRWYEPGGAFDERQLAAMLADIGVRGILDGEPSS